MTDVALLVQKLQQEGDVVATAESLTGGQLAARLTNAPGSSSIYAGGVVSYQTHVKIDVLGVPEAIVEEYGVVSAECALAMAGGVRRLCGTTWGLSTTGVAGPEEQEGKPVGMVFIGIAGPDGSRAVELSLSGERAQIQSATVDGVLSELAAIMGVSGRS